MQQRGLTIFPGEHKNSKQTLFFALHISQHMFSYLVHIHFQSHPAAFFLYLVELDRITQICFAIIVFIGFV